MDDDAATSQESKRKAELTGNASLRRSRSTGDIRAQRKTGKDRRKDKGKEEKGSDKKSRTHKFASTGSPFNPLMNSVNLFKIAYV